LFHRAAPEREDGSMDATPEYDAVGVGPGHNGLAATALLAKRRLCVSCLEKNGYAGGMAGTREIPPAAATTSARGLLFPLAKGLEDELAPSRQGVDFIDLPIMATKPAS
jgi:phytoene dehydrogenase-like protein